MEKKLILNLPIKTVSESNSTEHWSKKHKRHKTQKIQVRLALSNMFQRIQMPCTIKLVRVSPRFLDKDENLPMAFKHIKDYIADILIPGLQMGRADSDPRITWQYDQEKGNPQGIRIELSND